MKPAMQRDLLAAFWLLFDEFEIGNDDCPADDGGSHPQPASAAKVSAAAAPSRSGSPRRGA